MATAKRAKTTKRKATVLVLRTCDSNGKSYNGFKWSLKVGAKVIAPDWEPTSKCGNGLHGALWGEGDGSLLNWSTNAKWLVVEVDAASIVDLRGKVKFPSCVVRHVGNKDTAVAFIAARLPQREQAFTLIGFAATAGDGGTATAGYGGTATAGYGGTATAGDRGTATAGDGGTATAGYGGTATAGDWGTISVRWWDGSRYRFALGYIGENGIKANTKYRVGGSGVLVEVK